MTRRAKPARGKALGILMMALVIVGVYGWWTGEWR